MSEPRDEYTTVRTGSADIRSLATKLREFKMEPLERFRPTGILSYERPHPKWWRQLLGFRIAEMGKCIYDINGKYIGLERQTKTFWIPRHKWMC